MTSKNGILAVFRDPGSRIETFASIDRKSLERRVLTKEEKGTCLQIANFENTLVVQSRISSPGFRESQSTLTIWNSGSLARIGEIYLINQEVSHTWEGAAGKVFSGVNLKDDAELKDVEIGDIVAAENTI